MVGSCREKMGESLLRCTVESGVPLIEITVRFVPDIDHSGSTADFDLLGIEIRLTSAFS